MRKLFITLFVISGIVWLGGSVCRMVIGYDVYIPGTLEFKPAQTEAMRLHTVWMYALLGGWTGISFIAMLISGIVVFFIDNRRWKKQGWIVMCGILLALLAPGQIWKILADYRLWQLFDASTGMPLAPPQEVIDVFSKRVADVGASVINGLSLLIGLSVVIYLVVRPLTKPEERES